ncbi:MAG: hypothetical protein IT423_24720, partial [Pirellulaceae bacterium]|nr:hypothetical protein [Pirellulaceae bacterium]
MKNALFLTLVLTCSCGLFLQRAQAQLLTPGNPPSKQPTRLSYNRDVLPILADHCFACHGFDKGSRQAGLRLDAFEHAVALLPSKHYAIVPGKLAESQLVKRIESHDADQRMPPIDSGKPLSVDQIQILKQWIAEGATYEAHWSFLPPVATVPATVHATVPQSSDSASTSIDAFVL